jgi:hypothetical protein
MNVLEIPVGVAGRFKLVKHKADKEGNPIPGTTVVAADWFNNIITDQGLEYMGGNSGYYANCQIGSGNNAPAATDTQLETYMTGVAALSSSNSIQPSSPYYASNILVYRFAAGDGTGNISEIGTGWTAITGSLFSRALILDGGGSPTTITKLADEILDATYEFRVYPPEIDTTGSIMISAVPYDFTARASNVTQYSVSGFDGGWGSGPGGSQCNTKTQPSGMHAFTGALGAITAEPSGTSAQTTNVTAPAYIPASLYNENTLIWGITATDIGSYRSVTVLWSVGEFQVEFDPVIPKTTINELQLTFRISWARATIP